MKEFPPFRLDTINQCLWRRGESEERRILLTPKAFAVLRYLVEHASRLVTQDELLDAVWPDTFVQPEVLKYQIADIRSTLGDRAKNPLFIETLPRRGYQFVAAVQEAEPAAGAESPGPARRQLVGRGRELDGLRARLRRAFSGQRQLVFVTGEPGIGKTALVDEFQRLAAAEQPSLRIARGQCVEGYGGAEPYYPMLEALGQLCRGPAGKRVVEILAAQAPTWLVQFPALLKQEHRQTLQREILGATRDRMLREIREALDTLNQEAPLLFVFEDLQWVDPSTVDLISALARQRTTAKTMVIITKRLVDMVAPDHPLRRLKQDLLVHHLCEEITLEPLSETAMAEYLGAESPGDSLPEGFAELVHRHSEGNPLFMLAQLDHMNTHGQISRENGCWLLRVPLDEIDLGVPETLRQMIEAQIDHLTAEEQRALEVASVAGAPFSASIVAAAMKVDAEPLEEFFDRLSRRFYGLRAADFQQLGDGSISQAFEFVHAVYREVLYRRQTPARRAKLHQRIGEWTEAHWERPIEVAHSLAHHFEQAGDWPRTVKYLRLAAETAERRFAPGDAGAILRHALDLASHLPDAERAVNETEILEHLAGICFAPGDARAPETYADLVARADRYGLIDVEVRALTDWAFAVAWVNFERALELLERAFHLVRTLDPEKHLSTHATCVFFRLWICGWNPGYAEEYRNAIGEIRKLGNDVVAPHLLDFSCIQWCSSEYRDSYRNAVDGLKMLFETRSANPFHSMKYLLGEHVPAWNLIFLGEWGRALQEIDNAITMAKKNGDYYFRARNMQLTRAWLHLNACDFAGVLTICDSAFPVVRDPTLRAAPDSPAPHPHHRLSLMLRGFAEAAFGNHQRAREYLFAVRDEMDRQRTLHDWYWRMILESGLTELWLGERNLAEARPQAERFLALTLTTAERTWQALAWEANARVALAELDVPRAQDCIAQALSTMQGFETPLAAWRVHATASDLCRSSGNLIEADYHRGLSRASILKLADSLAEHELLRQEFLSSRPIRKVLGDAWREAVS